MQSNLDLRGSKEKLFKMVKFLIKHILEYVLSGYCKSTYSKLYIK